MIYPNLKFISIPQKTLKAAVLAEFNIYSRLSKMEKSAIHGLSLTK